MASVFVGNLSWDTTDETLHEIFDDQFAVVSAEVQRHRDGQRSKGWGLVTFEKADDVGHAIDTFHNTEIDGRRIIVREDRGATRKTSAIREKKVSEYDEEEDTKGVDEGPSTKLFVGNLSWDTTDEILNKAFTDFGTVVSAEVTMKPDGRSRGWGIVEMASVEDAEKALELDASDLDGRSIKVEFQRPRQRARTRKPRREQRQKREQRGDIAPSKSVYVGNLPWTYTSEDLTELFPTATTTEVKEGFDGRSRGYAIVAFASQDDASAAIEEVDGTDCGGRKIVVRFDRATR